MARDDSVNGTFRLFLRLVEQGLRHFDPGDPTILVEGTPEKAYFPEEPGWPVSSAPSAETISARLTELLAQGPVFLVPSWERQKEKSVAGKVGTSFGYDETLQRIRPLSDDSAVAVLLPASVLYSETLGAVATRRNMAEYWDTVAIAYARGVLPSVHPELQVATVFLRKKRSVRPPLRVYRVPRNGNFTELEADFQRILEREGGRVENGYVLRDVPSVNVGLDFVRHDPAVIAQRDNLADFGGLVPLGDIYDFLETINLHVAKEEKRLSGEDDPAAIRILKGRDVGRDGLIAPPGEETAWARLPERLQLAVGDIVVRGIYGSGDTNGLILAKVTPEDLPAAASNALIVLRPRVILTPQQADFTTMFLRAPLARTLLGTFDTRLSRTTLTRLSVPQPDHDLAEALKDLTAAKERLATWQKEAETLLQSVFLDQTPSAARVRIIGSGRTLRLRADTASLLDDLGYTVRTRFPYPVAARWREAEALRSAGSTTDAYDAVLAVAEILLCCTAQLALALTRQEGVELGAVQAIREKLRGGRSGPGLGDWAAVLNETATSKRLRTLSPGHPLIDLRGFLDDEDARAARQRLANRRNDQSHLRRVDQTDLPVEISDAFEDLKVLVDAAGFLTDRPLVQVTGVRRDSLVKSTRIEYRVLMGDHPSVPTRSEQHFDDDLETGSLYLRGHERRMHLLRPFLIGRNCPICRRWSTFHVDRAPDTTIVYKSLEDGHTVEEPTLMDAIKVVGLL